MTTDSDADPAVPTTPEGDDLPGVSTGRGVAEPTLPPAPEGDEGPGAIAGHRMSDQRTSQATAMIAAAVIVATGAALVFTFNFTKDHSANKLARVVVAVVVGIIGVWALYWAFDKLVSALPQRRADALRPVIFVGPALAMLALFLVYPAINTIVQSFQDRRSTSFVGLDNYRDVLTNRTYLTGIRNSLLWALLVPATAVAIGLAFATLADRLSNLGERVAKSIIFMPRAVSMVGASVAFALVYYFRAPGFGNQIGLVNALWDNVSSPVDWLSQGPWNNFLMMAVLIWLEVGFAMVILSSAIKGVPDDLLEAARIDGASEWKAFWRVVFPTISSTIVVVWTTVLITTWKLFDIVYVLTGGQNGTQIIAQQLYDEYFVNGNNGRGATLAVLLFIAVSPVLVMNIRRFRAQEANR